SPHLNANGLAQIVQTVIFEARKEVGNNVPCDGRAFINQPGVNLNKRSAGGDLLPSVFGGKNPTHADDGDFAAALLEQMANHFRAPRAQRATAESARFGVNAADGGVV